MPVEPVRFTCPRCAKRYRTPRSRLELAGGRLGVLCSGCGARLRVRLTEAGAEADLLSDAASEAEGHAGETAEADWGEAGSEAPEARGAEPEHAERAAPPVPAAGPSVGARLGRYEVEGVVGRGGMGTVYKAFDPSANRSVALKVLPADAPPEDAARFEREVQVQGNIHHPNLMPIFDSGTAGGFRWYTMELLREPLDLRELTVLARSGEAARSPRLKPVATLQGLVKHVLLPVCRAIHHANSREGVLHRDLTPYNVLVDATGLRPYVIDFGVCTLIERKNPRLAELPPETSPVVAGQRKVTGTLTYMPPEQLRGQSDRRGDVWALGALLHSAVTGEPPLQPVARASVPKAERIEGLKLLVEQALREGNAAEVARFRATLLAIEEDRERTPTDLHKDILQGNYLPRPAWLDPALDAVIGKAMAVDPANRYRNAKELADDLEAWLADEAVSALAEQQSGFGRLIYSAKRGLQRHRALVTVGVLALLGAGAYALWPRGDTGPTPEQRSAPYVIAAEAALARMDWTAAQKSARQALEQDGRSARAWALWSQAAGAASTEADLRWAAALAEAARAADARSDAAGAGSARAALRAALDRKPEDAPPSAGTQRPQAADLRRILDDRRPLTCALPPTATIGGLRRVDARGHVELLRKAQAGSQALQDGVAPGRWVLEVGAGSRTVSLPFEVTSKDTSVSVACPADLGGFPEGVLYVPAGRVDGPLGQTQVPALLWERTEVTIERYAAWLATLPAEEQAQRVPRVAGALGEAARPLWDRRDGKFVPPKSLAAQAPVDGISLYDARAFATAQGRRLPTAQEWAWAATGPFGAATPVGSPDALFSLPLTVGSSSPRPMAVASMPDDTAPFGLLDMAGNVAEWTSSLATVDGTNGWLVMGSGYGMPPERALVTRAVPEPGWRPIQGVGLRCVLPAP